MGKKNEVTISKSVRERLSDTYIKAEAKAEDSLWKFAVTVHKIVTSSDFNKGFKNLQDFADTVDRSKSSISKLVNAVKMREDMIAASAVKEVVSDMPYLEDFLSCGSVTQFADLSTIGVDDAFDLVSSGVISPDSSTREIKSIIDPYKSHKSESNSNSDDMHMYVVELSTAETRSVVVGGTCMLTETQLKKVIKYINGLLED